MSTITDEGRKVALERYGVRLLPGATDRSHLTGSSAIFGPFVEGDYITIAVTADSYLAAGGETAVASSDDVLLPAGVHDFVVPTGVTHVALYSSWSGAAAAVWKS